MQKINTIYQIILEIQQILESHELRGSASFCCPCLANLHYHAKNQFISLIPFTCSQFWSLVTRVSIPILTTPNDIFQLTFNFLKFGTTCKISSYIIILLKNLTIWLTRSILTWFKNPAIWLTRVIFVHTGTTYFPNMEIAQEYSKWYEFTL